MCKAPVFQWGYRWMHAALDWRLLFLWGWCKYLHRQRLSKVSSPVMIMGAEPGTFCMSTSEPCPYPESSYWSILRWVFPALTGSSSVKSWTDIPLPDAFNWKCHGLNRGPSACQPRKWFVTEWQSFLPLNTWSSLILAQTIGPSRSPTSLAEVIQIIYFLVLLTGDARDWNWDLISAKQRL